MNDERRDEASIVCELAQRVFAPSRIESVARVPEGASMRVYRVRLSNEAFYVRVLPEEGASFAPEVWVHTLLRERGVFVPEVIYWDLQNEALGRSVMVTTAIRGRHLGYGLHGMDAAAMRAALIAAGRDLAVINSIARGVWVDTSRRLRGGLPESGARDESRLRLRAPGCRSNAAARTWLHSRRDSRYRSDHWAVRVMA